MKKIILIIVFISIHWYSPAQVPAINWTKIAEGKISDYRKSKIQTISLKINDSLIKTIHFNGSNGLTVVNAGQDTLYSLFYDNLDRLSKVIKDNRVLDIGYFESDSTVQSLYLQTSSAPNDTMQKTAMPYQDYPGIIQNEFYAISKISHDTVAKEYHSAVINREDSGWSYIIYRKLNTEIKRYNNGTSVTTISQNGYYQYDSVVRSGGDRSDTYNYLVYPDSVWMTITKDSVYRKKIIAGKLIYENISFKNTVLYELFYAADSSIARKVIFSYYPDAGGSKILWAKTSFNADGKRIKTEYPNKKLYRKKKGVLKLRKKSRIPLISCGGSTTTVTYRLNKIWMISPSVLFPERVVEHFRPDYVYSRLDHFNLTDLTENEISYSKWRINAFNDSSRLRYNVQIPSMEKQFVFYPYHTGPGPLKYPYSIKDTYTLQIVTEEGKLLQSPAFAGNHEDPDICDMVIFKYLSDHR